MPQDFDLKAFFDKINEIFNTATSPARIVYNNVRGSLQNAETASRKRYEKSRDDALIHARFVAHKRKFEASRTRNGKLTFYFLANIERLPSPHSEEMMFKATMLIDSDPKNAVKLIGEKMRNHANEILNQSQPSLLADSQTR